jgi:hypothetical protein
MSERARTVEPPAGAGGAPWSSTGTPFRKRVGYYLFGVAIGCVVAGMILSARARLRPKGPVVTPATTSAPADTLPSQQGR